MLDSHMGAAALSSKSWALCDSIRSAMTCPIATYCNPVCQALTWRADGCRCKAAEARITDAQAQVEAQEQQLQTLQETLQAERAAAAAEAASAEAQHEHLLADARAELAGAGQRDRETLEQTLLSQLADKAKEVEGVQREAQRLQGELSGMAQAVQEAQELVQRNEQLERCGCAAERGMPPGRVFPLPAVPLCYAAHVCLLTRTFLDAMVLSGAVACLLPAACRPAC